MDKTEYYREYRRRKEGKPDYSEEDMEECLLCHKRYVFVGGHVRLAHHLLMADYKKDFGLDMKRGRTRGQFRELKNKTNRGVKNLACGAMYRFKKNDIRAGRYTRSKETEDRLRKQGLKIGKLYGGNHAK